MGAMNGMHVRGLLVHLWGRGAMESFRVEAYAGWEDEGDAHVDVDGDGPQQQMLSLNTQHAVL